MLCSGCEFTRMIWNTVGAGSLQCIQLGLLPILSVDSVLKDCLECVWTFIDAIVRFNSMYVYSNLCSSGFRETYLVCTFAKFSAHVQTSVIWSDSHRNVCSQTVTPSPSGTCGAGNRNSQPFPVSHLLVICISAGQRSLWLSVVRYLATGRLYLL